MKNSKTRYVIPLLAVGAFAGSQAISHLSAYADKKHPKATLSTGDLEKMRGPRPPAGATYSGTEANPAVGDMPLPINDVEVYQFVVKTAAEATVPVKWAYSAGTGTFMWATAPIQCENGSTIARGGFVMKIREDGSGSYALGTKQCPVGRISGCSFDAHQKDTACGACAWNGVDLACTTD